MKIRKRIGAFLIDMFIVMMLAVTLSNLSYLNPYKSKYEESSKQYEEVLSGLEKVLEENTATSNYVVVIEYMNESVMPALANIERYSVFNSLWYIIIFFLYNVVFAFFNEGQTLGKKMFKLRIVNKDSDSVTFPRLIIRSLFNGTSLFFGINIILIIRTLCTFINNNQVLIPIYYVLQLLSIAIEISLIITLIVNKGDRLTNDILAKTEVIDVK